MIWYGAGRIVKSADKFSHKLKISSFAFSFLVLGLLTSTPEFAVGLTALAEGKPDIYIGNLIGGIPVLFLFVIPVLALLGKGLALKKSINQKNLLLSFGVILLPSVFIIDQKVTIIESVLSIMAYGILLFFVQREKGVFDNGNKTLLSIKSYSLKDILEVIYGIGLVFVASHYIVDGTRYFAEFFNISTFFLSLILVSLGTNLPELSLAIKSALEGKKDVAFGDYVGSGAANTLLFGLFGIIYGKTAMVNDNFLVSCLMLLTGLCLFYLFARTKYLISQIEGVFLIILFLLFGVAQLF
jgi:cation:H+ antiporter